eukprot:CAMPEP_0197609386 /NCGR_PEP_ID=MMETSP1326-20131121/51123_1 /TAXON_ID=1155430 /ORGANISM="Genus nov. species nov., Strain RCC2288" /LENGTH=74 /DNA_ID=CAMNT_0043177757 /DNA_START=14 /DNA_END=234 /DNA_ORIENTATION=-
MPRYLFLHPSIVEDDSASELKLEALLSAPLLLCCVGSHLWRSGGVGPRHRLRRRGETRAPKAGAGAGAVAEAPG